jgi:hypothetical protein
LFSFVLVRDWRLPRRRIYCAATERDDSIAKTAWEDIVTAITDCARGLGLPDVQAKCKEIGVDVVANTPQEFAAYVKKEVDKWHRVIVDARIPQIQ